MSTKLKVLEIFRQRGEEYISGQQLGEALGVSRNSVKVCRRLPPDPSGRHSVSFVYQRRP